MTDILPAGLSPMPRPHRGTRKQGGVATLTFAADGVEIRRGVLSGEDIDAVNVEVTLDGETLQRSGIRNLEKKFPSIARLAASPVVLSIVETLLCATPQLVRALFFDKTAQRNWSVMWHQDRTVTLNQKTEIPGWGNWSIKDGVCHGQPPCAVLNQMVTIRLHIDPANEVSGCLRVIPGSHRLGILEQEAIPSVVATEKAVACVVGAGDAVVMRPHVIHSSGKSRGFGHRRVVHLEYSSYELPAGVWWA